MFLNRSTKNNAYPCKPQFYYIKVGFKGSKLYRHVFVMRCLESIERTRNVCLSISTLVKSWFPHINTALLNTLMIVFAHIREYICVAQISLSYMYLYRASQKEYVTCIGSGELYGRGHKVPGTAAEGRLELILIAEPKVVEKKKKKKKNFLPSLLFILCFFLFNCLHVCIRILISCYFLSFRYIWILLLVDYNLFVSNSLTVPLWSRSCRVIVKINV